MKISCLERFRKAVVYDQPHVGLVDSHPEGDRRHDDRCFVFDEPVLRCPTERRIETGVVGQGIDAAGRQIGSQVLGFVP